MNKEVRLEKRLLVLDPSNMIERVEIEKRKNNTYYNKILSSDGLEYVSVPMHIANVEQHKYTHIPQQPNIFAHPQIQMTIPNRITNNKNIKMIIT
jgi:hypothetical protein